MPKRILFGAMALMMAIIFAGAGCGGPGGAGPTADKSDKGKSAGGMEEVCKYFPKELVEEAIGRPIVKVEDESMVVDHICTYYTVWSETYDHTPYGDKPGGAGIVVVLEDESVADNKTEFEAKGYTFKKDESYSWDNYLITSRGSKTPYRADLIVNENRFFRINSNHFAATDEEIVKIGKRFSERMKNGK